MTLKEIILDKVKKKPILFREFMQLALYYPDLGYYSGPKDKISSQGDFITATTQSSLFARTFARQFYLVLSKLGNDTSIIEFGAGNGKFAADCIDELSKLNCLPDKYIIIELSNDLKLRQQEYVKKNIPKLYDKFIWLNELPEQKTKAIVFANEVLDAMPVDIFESKEGGIFQQGVALETDGNTLKLIDISENDNRFNSEVNRIVNDGVTFEDGYISEINTWIRPWIKALRDSLLQGIVFLCDYGYHRAEYYSKERNMGTLACYHQHKVNFDPFVNIGEQDITAHVDFTAVAEAATEVGFLLDGYMTQANFLKRSGISEVFTDLSKSLSLKEQLRYNSDIKDLLLNDKLAEVFKVIAFSLDFDFVLESFDNDDNIDYLL
ncbi:MULTISPECIES: class I SAM-dependent methyltransferase [unclassified Francisella]|uniref:class I SAM-dependent methyltransferase n=1 Tax=unclassified Francisella TaxID=2610885 RepID=UPI002E321183|nr:MULTISPECIES: SAM-dependent methyltransferase [unclassified Francisella]MED7820042.1 SAM-dependent methyltransferase [Francisella sp. 19S2-4]MED7830862.1 SAM-dependent methyltransferase [Francisella sp. 19S2-10]